MKKVLYILISGLMLTACNADKTTEAETETTSVNEAEETVQKPTEDAIIREYIAEKGWEAKRDPSGVYVVIENPGEGDDRPEVTDEVTLYYKGYFMDGEQFDGTKDAPIVFGLQRLIPGWQVGIPYFGKGGKGKLIIPHKMGYGRNDYGPIPGESILIFDIEVIDWNANK